MWFVVPSFEATLQALFVVFTQPSFETNGQILLGWLMCLGHRTEFRVFEAFQGERVARNVRHPFDRCYNFFSRAASAASFPCSSANCRVTRSSALMPTRSLKALWPLVMGVISLRRKSATALISSVGVGSSCMLFPSRG